MKENKLAHVFERAGLRRASWRCRTGVVDRAVLPEDRRTSRRRPAPPDPDARARGSRHRNPAGQPPGRAKRIIRLDPMTGFPRVESVNQQSEATARGFTLLEMMVATMIMGIAVVGCCRACRRHAQRRAPAPTTTAPCCWPGVRMNELLLDRRCRANAVIEGRFDPATTGGLEAGWRGARAPSSRCRRRCSPGQTGARPHGTGGLVDGRRQAADLHAGRLPDAHRRPRGRRRCAERAMTRPRREPGGVTLLEVLIAGHAAEPALGGMLMRMHVGV